MQGPFRKPISDWSCDGAQVFAWPPYVNATRGWASTMMVALRRRWGDFVQSGLFGACAFNLYHSARARILSLQSDEVFAQRFYRRFSGKLLNLSCPRTFDEKLWWLKLYYRDPLMTQCTDKFAVREYVESKGLGHLLMPLIGAYGSPEEIDWSSLPRRFYVKTNNSSGTNLRCDDRDSLDTHRLPKLLATYLHRDHYALSREWNYRNIEPRILIEPIIDSPSENGLIDYRFLCSKGVCKGIFVDVDTADRTGAHRSDAKRNVYDRNWNLLDVRVTRPRIENRVIERPKMLEEMIRCAEALSGTFPFCRVDLYNPVPEKVIFGEITFFHAGGNNRIDPEEYQLKMGAWIDMPSVSLAPSGRPLIRRKGWFGRDRPCKQSREARDGGFGK